MNMLKTLLATAIVASSASAMATEVVSPTTALKAQAKTLVVQTAEQKTAPVKADVATAKAQTATDKAQAEKLAAVKKAEADKAAAVKKVETAKIQANTTVEAVKAVPTEVKKTATAQVDERANKKASDLKSEALIL